jgi:hypothetical protein
MSVVDATRGHAFGTIGAALSKESGVFQASSLKAFSPCVRPHRIAPCRGRRGSACGPPPRTGCAAARVGLYMYPIATLEKQLLNMIGNLV